MVREPEPVRITTATRSHRDDIAARQKRYLISMGIRTVCFVLAIVCIGHWIMWVFLVASFLLPTIAVVVANSAAPLDPGGPDYFDPRTGRAAIEGPDGARRPPV
jgi:Protein of unknown function (DUF3099)